MKISFIIATLASLLRRWRKNSVGGLSVYGTQVSGILKYNPASGAEREWISTRGSFSSWSNIKRDL
jgi:hypothetical protein